MTRQKHKNAQDYNNETRDDKCLAKHLSAPSQWLEGLDIVGSSGYHTFLSQVETEFSNFSSTTCF